MAAGTSQVIEKDTVCQRMGALKWSQEHYLKYSLVF